MQIFVRGKVESWRKKRVGAAFKERDHGERFRYYKSPNDPVRIFDRSVSPKIASSNANVRRGVSSVSVI
jgi:hypothetical protein